MDIEFTEEVMGGGGDVLMRVLIFVLFGSSVGNFVSLLDLLYWANAQGASS